MVLKRGATGRLLKGSEGRLARENGCCCKCKVFDVPCDSDGCQHQGFSVCCVGCGDYVTATFGTITAADVDGNMAVETMAAALSGASVDIPFVYIEGSYSVWYYTSDVLASDDNYGYGYVVLARGVGNPYALMTEMFWALYASPYRVPIEEYRGGDCSSAELVDGAFQPGVSGVLPNGNCMGTTDASLPLSAPSGDTYLSVLEDAVSVVVHGGCDLIADCDALPSTLLVECGCWEGIVARAPDPMPYRSGCEWSYSRWCQPEECPCTDMWVVLSHTTSADGFCGWKLMMEKRSYATDGIYCGELTEVRELVAYKVGGDEPMGEYSIILEGECLGSVMVS